MQTERKEKPLVIYHANCLDGFGAAFAAWLKFGDDADYVALDYPDRRDFCTNTDMSGRDIYVLDFSFGKLTTEALIEVANKFIWLDHHKTAFEEWLGVYQPGITHDNYTKNLHIQLNDNKSGTILAWEYFHPETPVPLWAAYIDDRDRWQWKLVNTKHFCFALSQLEQSFKVWNDTIWNVDCLINKGNIINEYYTSQLNRAIEATLEECEILGQRGLCANLPPMFASEAGNILATKSGTFGATWFKCSDGSVKWSLRSNGDYDVSELARQFGGGGHKNAAGFVFTPDSGISGAESGVKLWHI